MRTILWVTRPEAVSFAGAQHETMRDWLRGEGWQINVVPHQHRLLWRERRMSDVLIWTFAPTQLEVWLAKRLAQRQFGLIHELDSHETLPTLDHWLVPSKPLRDGMLSRGIEAKKVTITAVLPRVSLGGTKDVRRDLGLKTGTPLIYTAGPLVHQAGNRIAIWALNILNYLHPDVHLTVHGDGPERERLVSFSQSIDDRMRVHFVSSSWSTADLVDQADQVWLPRQTDGVPDALLLALQAGKPIVASRQLSHTQWLRHEDSALLVEPEQPAAWAAAGRRLLEDVQLTRTLAAGSRQLCPPSSLDETWHGLIELGIGSRITMAA